MEFDRCGGDVDQNNVFGYGQINAYAAVQQAIGTKPDRPAAAAFLREFVEEAKSSGLVASLIEKHGVVGRLTVAPAA